MLSFFTCTGLSPISRSFPPASSSQRQYNSVVLQPHICRNMYGLGSFVFARHYLRNHYYFLLLRLLRCFSSARSRILQLSFRQLGCPIRKSTDQFAFANPRSLSQLITSFIASESLGIPCVPLFTFFTSVALLLLRCCFIILNCFKTILLSSLVFFFFQYVKELFVTSLL